MDASSISQVAAGFSRLARPRIDAPRAILYSRPRTVSEDDRYVEEYAPLVRSLASRVHRSLSLTCEVEELVAFGFGGLVEARSRFDPSRGAKFNTFAYYRIRGAILDGVRAMAYLPRRAHAKLRAAEAADQLTEELGDTAGASGTGDQPTSQEAAQAVADTLSKLTASYVLSSLGQGEESTPETPESLFASKVQAEALRAAVRELPEKERALVVGFYFEGRRFDEVAAELGISKSWASRLHSKALALLRGSLSPDGS